MLAQQLPSFKSFIVLVETTRNGQFVDTNIVIIHSTLIRGILSGIVTSLREIIFKNNNYTDWKHWVLNYNCRTLSFVHTAFLHSKPTVYISGYTSCSVEISSSI